MRPRPCARGETFSAMLLGGLVASLVLCRPARAAESAPATDATLRGTGRFVVTTLLGTVLGGLCTYGADRALCRGSACLEGAVGGLGANLLVAPMAVWSLGEWMGGDGSLAGTYLFAGAGFGAAGATVAEARPRVTAGLGLVSVPLGAAVGYEFTGPGIARPTVEHGAP